jgi:hypothetical protein
MIRTDYKAANLGKDQFCINCEKSELIMIYLVRSSTPLLYVCTNCRCVTQCRVGIVSQGQRSKAVKRMPKAPPVLKSDGIN